MVGNCGEVNFHRMICNLYHYFCGFSFCWLAWSCPLCTVRLCLFQVFNCTYTMYMVNWLSMNIRPLIIFPLCSTCAWIVLNVLPAQPPPMVQMNCIAYCVLILLIIYIQLNYAFYFIAGFVLLYLVFFQCSRQPHLVSSPLKYRMTIFLANILCLTTFMLIFSV